MRSCPLRVCTCTAEHFPLRTKSFGMNNHKLLKLLEKLSIGYYSTRLQNFCNEEKRFRGDLFGADIH